MRTRTTYGELAESALREKPQHGANCEGPLVHRFAAQQKGRNRPGALGLPRQIVICASGLFFILAANSTILGIASDAAQ
jgi:hypothetical protein